jgi:hypothetical protein
VFIGPTPNIQLRLPFEAGVDAYFHHPVSPADTVWSRSLYEELLPESWRSREPVYEAYYAGKAGRTEIIAHGTTIDPEFYRNLPCYPFTPSLGCLTTLELWSPLTGICGYSDQVELLNAYHSVGNGPGFFVLLELDDRKMPVTPGEVLPELLAAEPN